MTKKTYLLDTNVLLTSPYALYAFDDNDVVLADITLEELDHLKTAPGDTGYNARETNRILNELQSQNSIAAGIQMPGGGRFHVETNYINEKLPPGWDEKRPDHRILRVANGMSGKLETPVILVTNDVSMRLKADICGVRAEDYNADKSVDVSEQYRGRRTVTVAPATLEAFYTDGGLDPKRLRGLNPVLNEFFILRSRQDAKKTALARFDGERLVPLRYLKEKPYGVTARNVGQQFVQEMLMTGAEAAPLVILKGPAGTAKTFYALAVGLEKVIRTDEYRKILITRANVKFDEDIGFLKGTEEEKIMPLIRPSIDNLELLLSARGRKKGEPLQERDIDSEVRSLFEDGIITAQALAYLRGRSITNTWILIDEAQNLTPTQALGIITRAGIGSKIILAGDPDQIDHPRLDRRTNGLVYASERMKGSPLCWQTSFEGHECTRSPLALDAAQRMTSKGLRIAGKS